MSFIKVGTTFFNQKADGSLIPVVDPETNKHLKSGNLPYTSRSNTDALTFASGASVGVQQGGSTIGSINLTPEQIALANKNNPTLSRSLGLNLVPSTTSYSAPTSQVTTPNTPAGTTSSPTDLSAMLQSVLKSVLEPAAGAENLADLEARRQALLRKQLLSEPYSEEGERVLSASQKLQLMQTRGQQFEPELQALDREIASIRDNNVSALEKLQAVSMVLDIQERMSPTASNEQDFNDSKALRQEFIKASGEFVAIRDSYNRILASADNPSAAGDLALIFNYMKMLDPASVVREGEFATAQNTGSIPERVRSLYNRLMTGERLTDVMRADFIDRANAIYDATNKQQESLVEQYIGLASRYGLDPQNVVIDLGLYDAVSGSSSSSKSSGERMYVDGYGWYSKEGGNWVLESSSGTTGKSGGEVEATAPELARAIAMHETGGSQVYGNSGEYGVFQFLPSTWNKLSSEYNKQMTGDDGPLEMTSFNEYAVAEWKIGELLQKYTPYEVALIWNTSLGGSEKPLEKSGVNEYGVPYDSIAYANSVISKLG